MGSIVYNYEDIAKRVLGDDWFPKKPAAVVEPLKAIVAPASIEELLSMDDEAFGFALDAAHAQRRKMTDERGMSAEDLIQTRSFIDNDREALKHWYLCRKAGGLLP